MNGGGIHEEFPEWPRVFAERRQFDRHAENQPYIEFLQTEWFDGEEDEEEDDVSSVDDDDVSILHDNEVERHRNKSEIKDENRCNDKDTKESNRPGNVRLFMTGMTGDKNALPYRDQVEEVASFCEQAQFGNKEKTPEEDKRVALLDDRNIRGTILAKKGTSPPGDCRPYLGPLTWRQLGEELIRNRFRVPKEQNVPPNAFEDEESDAERRVLFITHLNASTIEVLVVTVSRTQAPALKDLLYKHLTGKPSIGVTIPYQGFKAFTLEFHIPYYALRVHKELLKDTRKKSDGNP